MQRNLYRAGYCSVKNCQYNLHAQHYGVNNQCHKIRKKAVPSNKNMMHKAAVTNTKKVCLRNTSL